MKLTAAAFLLTLSLCCLRADPYRIYFKDKGPLSAGFDSKNGLYESTMTELTERAKMRRAKTLGPNILKLEDAPVYHVYKNAIASLSDLLYTEVRWFNYVVAETSEENIELIEKYEFVLKWEPVASHGVVLGIPDPSPFVAKEAPGLQAGSEGHTLSYGPSFNQANVLGIPGLHDMGITGEDVLIGFTDTGFLREHASLKNVSVAGELDFIYKDMNTANENGDPSNQHNHGTAVLAVAMGLQPDSLIGTAPGATALLAKTEDMRNETHMEEDFYAAALEWLEFAGADIINTSLGYKTFDAGHQPYSFEELDGRQPVSTRAANKATEKGVLMVVAAGNSGPADSTIAAPADGDSVLTVAGMKSNISGLWSGSSHGPVASGRQKPDVTAIGIDVIIPEISSADALVLSSGTSFSAPAISGAAAVLLSANPNLTQYELKELLRQSGRNASFPDSRQGYGVPDLGMAIGSMGCFLAPLNSYPVDGALRVATYLRSAGEPELHVRAGGGEVTVIYMKQGSTERQYYADIPLSLFGAQDVSCHVIIPCENNYIRYPREEGSFIALDPTLPDISLGVDPDSLPKETGTSAGNPEHEESIRYSDGNVIVRAAGIQAEGKLRLYDITGNLVADMECRTNETAFTGPLPAGVYIAAFSSGKYMLSSKILSKGR